MDDSSGEMPKLDPPGQPSTTQVAPAKKRGWPAGMCRAHKRMDCAECKTAKPKRPNTSVVKLSNDGSNSSNDADRGPITDTEVGNAISGAFMLTSLPLGSHWRLFPHEEFQLGRCFGPIARRYPEFLGKYVDLLVTGPVVAAIIVPRIGIQQLVNRNDVPKERARDALRVLLSAVEAEKQDNIASLKEEQAKWQKAVAAKKPPEEKPKTEETGVVPGVTENATA